MVYKYVIGYLRLSREDEYREDESNSISNQRLLIQHFIEKQEEFRESEVLFFSEDGFTGTSFNRPGFKEMMEFIQKKGGCCIVVKDLSRFGRDTIDSQNYLEKVFPFLHVRFIAINDFYDSDSSAKAGKDMEIKFKNLINGIYPQICSQNIKQVMRKQAEMGKYHGAVPPFGYRFPENSKTELLVDEEAAQTVRLIFKYFLEGKEPIEIARKLNDEQVVTPTMYMESKGYKRNLQVASIWLRYMVSRILTNPLYTGTMVNHRTENRIVSVKSAVKIPREEWICVPGTHEAIIPQKEFDAVMAAWTEKHNALKKNRNGALPVKGNQSEKKPALNGKIRCGQCRRKIRIRTYGKRQTTKIYCYSVNVSNPMGCYEKGYNIAGLDALVLELIKKQALLAEDTIKAVKQLDQTTDTSKLRRRIKTLEEKLNACKIQKRRLYEKYVSGDLPQKEYLLEKEKVFQKEEQYRKRADETERMLLEVSRQKERECELQGIAKFVNLESLSREVVEELVDTVYFYDPEHIEVIWNFKDDLLAYAGKDETSQMTE